MKKVLNCDYIVGKPSKYPVFAGDYTKFTKSLPGVIENAVKNMQEEVLTYLHRYI